MEIGTHSRIQFTDTGVCIWTIFFILRFYKYLATLLWTSRNGKQLDSPPATEVNFHRSTSSYFCKITQIENFCFQFKKNQQTRPPTRKNFEFVFLARKRDSPGSARTSPKSGTENGQLDWFIELCANWKKRKCGNIKKKLRESPTFCLPAELNYYR